MPPRPLLAGAALWLAGIALVFTRILILDPGNNAYLWLWGTGVAMLPPSIAFALAAAVPWPIGRQASWLAALGMLALSGGGGLLALLAGLAIAALQGGSAGGPVLLAHGAGLALLVVTLYVLGVQLRRAAR